jgi:ribulose-phosphate 3-epimerase
LTTLEVVNRDRFRRFRADVADGTGASAGAGQRRRRRASGRGDNGGVARPPIAIVPSVLPADFSRLAEECIALEKAGADRIQWDVMDGQFVPNLTFGPDVIAACRPHTTLPFEAHLMVETPERLLPRYVEAGCEIVIVHAESTAHLHRVLGQAHELGARPAVALNPATPAVAVANVLDLVELVLVMTVNPGFGGQDYIASMEPKIAEVRRMIDARERAGNGSIDLEVDGGIAPDTVAGAVTAGANVLVTGSALFRDPEGLGHAVGEIRKRAESAPPS